MFGTYIAIGIASVFVIFLVVILIRTFNFKPKKTEYLQDIELHYDADAAIHALSELVKCKTVSFYDHSLEDDAEFEKLINMLPSLYPHVYEVCTLQRMEDRGLLFHWKGTEGGDPVVLMAHYDVVPVEEENWTHPAFEGLIEDGILWGRGSLDTKVTFNGILSAANNLIHDGFKPKRDIYFAFSGGEEINGDGAVHIVDYFEAQHITPYLVIDEGGAVVEGVFPGVSAPCGLIGIAEKGMMNLEMTLESNGGHASAPQPHTPVGTLAKACVEIENHPFKNHFTKPVLEMFDTLGRYSSFGLRMIFANMWLFGGLLDVICRKKGGELNALVRTTCALTQMQGSLAPNVIPPKAKIVANLRLNPMDSIASAQEYLRKVIKNDQIQFHVSSSMEPSRISETNCEAFNIVCSAVHNTWKGCLVSPYLMIQCSDSRHYGKISDRVYKFSAMDLTLEERHSIHGNDEHIRLETLKRAVEFYLRVIQSC